MQPVDTVRGKVRDCPQCAAAGLIFLQKSFNKYPIKLKGKEKMKFGVADFGTVRGVIAAKRVKGEWTLTLNGEKI